MVNTGISVIICCYNSRNRIQQTLRHIAGQEVPGNIQWEVILVNNSSTDDTVAVARQEWQQYNVRTSFRLVDESIPGLSSARSKGISEAKYGYVLFCDDDNWLSSNYVRIAFETMEQHPDVAIAGGQTSGFFETDKPDWFDSFSQSYVVEKPLPESGYLSKDREYLAGAGMILRKDFTNRLEQLNFRPKLSDRTGNNLMSGGDYELCLLAGFMGFRIYYNEMLKLTHYMPASRLTWNYCLEMTTVGHAIPEIYFDLYRIVFNNADKNTELSFPDLFKKLLRKYYQNLFFPGGPSWRNAFQPVINIRYFLWQYPGSLKQRKTLSAKNKVIYMIRNKKGLSSHYTEMITLAKRIQTIDERGLQ